MSAWQWSEQYKDSYMVTYDGEGNPIYHWAKHVRADSGASSAAAEASAAVQQSSPPQSQSSPGGEGKEGTRIRGTTGDYEPLDSQFSIRKDAKTFFTRGQVFAMIFTESMSTETAKLPPEFGTNKTYLGSVSVVKYGQYVYTQARRFVVVDEKKGFCYACPISTYTGRATLKPGCRPSEHSVIYNIGQQEPELLSGETGILNQPIGVKPVFAEPMHKASRLRFGKVHPIEHNVKVKDLGRVCDEDMSYLLTYYRNEHN